MTTISWGLNAINTQQSEYIWDWSSTPAVFTVGTSPQLILSASSEPRLISYRAEAPSDTRIKIWENGPTSGEHEQDSYGGHNIADWELASALKIATVSGTAKIVVNTAEKIII